MTLTRIPDELREALPDDLDDAEMTGTDVAAADESVRLYGPPGTGKTTEAISLRTAARAVEQDLAPEDVTVVTYRTTLAGEAWDRMVNLGIYSDEREGEDGELRRYPAPDPASPRHTWGTIYAVASRVTGFHDRFHDDDGGAGPGGMMSPGTGSDTDTIDGMLDEHAAREFCEEHGLQRASSVPWIETRWTTFRRLYTYARSNLIEINGEGPDPASHDLSTDAGALRLLDAFSDEWGSARSSDPFAKFRAVTQTWEDWKDEKNVADFWEILDAGLTGSLPPMEHVVIDEYHDVTPLMATLCERWIDAADTVIVAGDPDQTVNNYAGADPRFFERLDERVSSDLPTVLLDETHRVPRTHYAAAAEVLGTERSVPDVTPVSGLGQIREVTADDPIETTRDGSFNTPSEAGAASPVRFVEEFNADADDACEESVMLLARTQRQVAGIGAALDAAGIVYDAQEDVAGDWDERRAVMRAIAAISGETRAVGLAGPEQGVRAVPRTLSLPTDDMLALARHTRSDTLTDGRDALTAAIREFDRHNTLPAFELDNVVTNSFWHTYGSGSESISELVEFDAEDKAAMMNAVDRYGSLRVPETGVSILTIHAAKGSEADHVVVWDGVTGRSRDSENEVRVWYVALTRAQNSLTVVRDGHEWTTRYLPDGLVQKVRGLAAEHREVSA